MDQSPLSVPEAWREGAERAAVCGEVMRRPRPGLSRGADGASAPDRTGKARTFVGRKNPPGFRLAARGRRLFAELACSGSLAMSD